jgi:hypothetical protein
LETAVRNGFPPPTSLKQLADVLEEDWYNMLLDVVHNLYEFIPRRITAVLKAIGGPIPHQQKKMCSVSVTFPLFCPTSVY